jgi:hypothetical protein
MIWRHGLARRTLVLKLLGLVSGHGHHLHPNGRSFPFYLKTGHQRRNRYNRNRGFLPNVYSTYIPTGRWGTIEAGWRLLPVPRRASVSRTYNIHQALLRYLYRTMPYLQYRHPVLPSAVPVKVPPTVLLQYYTVRYNTAQSIGRLILIKFVCI